MRTIRLDLEYDGTHYAGWQRQKERPTVQQVIEDGLSRIADERVVLFAASRTDRGVHARHQVASFSLYRSTTPAAAFFSGAPSVLPPDVRLRRVLETHASFHANRDVLFKTYRYFLIQGRPSSVFFRHHAWTVPGALDFPRMEVAARALTGEHDFSAFRTGEAMTRTPVRHVRSIRFGRGQGRVRWIDISADGFLRQMVRNLVGLLVDVGRGNQDPGFAGRVLASKDRAQSSAAAPAHGLFLWRVAYGKAPVNPTPPVRTGFFRPFRV